MLEKQTLQFPPVQWLRVRLRSITPTQALIALIVACSAVLIGAASYKYSYWGQGFDMVDFHMPIWGSLQGKFLLVSRYNFTDTFMGLDVAFGFLPAIPFYAIVPSAYTLVVVQILFITSAAIPVYLIAHDRFGAPWAGIAWATVYLIYPTTQFMAMAGPFQPRVPALVCFFWVFYCLERRRLAPYLALLFVAMTARTDAALVVIAFGMYAALRRYDWRWSALPLVVALIYFYAAITYITPLFYNDTFQPQRVSTPFDLNRDYNDMWPCGVSPQACYYLHLGGSLPEIAKNILTHPVEVIAFVFQPEKVWYLFLMFGALLFLPLSAPRELLLPAPIFAINLLSNRVYQYVITEQYQILVIPGIVIAGICGSAWLWQRLNRRWTMSAPVGLAVLVALVALLNIPLKNPVVSALRNPERPERVALMEQMAAQIPSDAAVAATSFLAPHLLPRQHLYYLPGGPMHVPVDQAEYAFIDTRAKVLEGTNLIERLRDDPQWRVLAEQDDLILFKQDAMK
ncbi:MAG: DUF2079 domain-containing protein [Chloroflexales bacterium]|nr:DUF2079 domain-containing protein [Chloroflexales bacterium]